MSRASTPHMPLACWPAQLFTFQPGGGSTSKQDVEHSGAAGAGAAAAASLLAPLHRQSDAGQLGGDAPQLSAHQAASTLVRVRARARGRDRVWVGPGLGIGLP